MVRHTPKLRALRSLLEQQLSAAGEARLRAHLAGCDACSQALRGMRLADALIGAARLTEPALDYAKIQAKLVQHHDAKRGHVRSKRAVALWIAPVLVAAAALWLFLRPAPEPAQAPREAAPLAARQPAPSAPAEPAAIRALVTALAGPASVIRASGTREALQLDAALEEGDGLELGPDALAHLRLADATGCMLGAGSRATFHRLRAEESRIELHTGRVISQVRTLAEAQRFTIEADGFTVSVRGTHFEVALERGRLSVVVAEGHVRVQDRTGRLLADLRDRERFTSGGALPPPAAVGGDAQSGALELPRSLGLPLSAWPPVRLLDLGKLAALGVTGLVLDGNRAPVQGELTMRVPRGEVTLIAERGARAARTTVLQVPPEGLSLAPDALGRLLRLQGTSEPSGTPADERDPASVMNVVRAGTPALQRCYERALRVRPELGARLTIRVRITASGRVSQVTPLGTSPVLPDDLVSCMRNSSRQWRFPATRSPTTIDIPLRLQPR